MAGHTSRPLPVSLALSTLAAIVAVLFVSNTPGQIIAVAITVVGLTVLAGGLELFHRGRRLVAGLLVVVGAVVLLGGFGWGLVAAPGITAKLELLPGLLGLWVLVVGLSAGLRGYERWFVNAGTGLLLLSIILGGYLHGASVPVLLAATAATVVAWDVGEQGINMCEQVGREARTWPVELAHCCGAVLVGAIAVVLAIVVFDAGVSGVPLMGLTTLLGAVVVLAASLYV